MTVRDAARSVLPRRIRRIGRLVQRELPVRIHDLLAGGSSECELPPARLRLRVALTSSRAEFLSVGSAVAACLLEAARSDGCLLDEARILDFGCGCGRVARHIIARQPGATVFGIDVDREAVAWCSRHLRGQFMAVPAVPPTSLAAGAFGLIYAVSIFTHLDEKLQDRWLGEIERLLEPGGLFMASTHNPVLTFERPDLSEAQHRTLRETGFLFAAGEASFKEDSAFHAPEYLRAHWLRWFDFVRHEEHGLAGYQDLSVWRRRI
jgi:SAM-dependent methyltransferase